MSRARDGGGGRGVVMVAQRGGTKREATSKPSAKQRGGDKPVDHDKKRMSVAGGMWSVTPNVSYRSFATTVCSTRSS